MKRLKTQALVDVAEAAWQHRVYYQAAAMLEEALRRDPMNIRLIVDLAMTQGKMRDYEAAERLLDRAARLAPRKASALRMIAQVYATIDRHEQAAEFYRRALSVNSDAPTAVETLVDLASLYERRHLLDAARGAVDEALGRDPSHERGRLQQAVLDRRGGDMDLAESRLRAMVGGKLDSSEIASFAWYELGQLLDKRGRYDEAFAALQAAKQCVYPARGNFLAASQYVERKIDETLATLGVERYDRWSAVATDDAAYRCALMTSYPRSGTTLAEQVLDSHDALVSADEFDVMDQWVFQPLVQRFSPTTPTLEVIERVPPAVRQEARRTYWQRTESILGEPIGTRVLLDKNPALTPMLPLVNWAFPEMKLLIAIRDPRDVVLSCFMQRVPLNAVSVHWLTLADASRDYARNMTTWLKIREVTKSPWLEFRYEDMVENLEDQSRRLLEFLELPWDDKVLEFHERAREKRVRSPTYEAVTRPVYRESVGRWRHYARHFELVADILKPFVAEFGYDD